MANSVVEAVRAAGIVGAGGAGFPTHVKLDARVDLVIVNGAECEPLLHVDVHLMEHEAERLVRGLCVAMEATGAKRGTVAIKGKHPRAIESVRAAVAQAGCAVDVFVMEDYYPAGDEHVLVADVTGKIVPEGGIPLAVGVVVANVETLCNVASAMQGEPVTRTYVTIAGAVSTPMTVALPVGTSVADALELAGGPLTSQFAIFDGGPMMGIETALDRPITKTSKGLIVLPGDHRLVKRKTMDAATAIRNARAVCCFCRYCTDLCPRYLLGHALEPHRTMIAVGHNAEHDVPAYTSAFLCVECNICQLYACPLDLSPRRVYQAIKPEFARQGVKNPHRRSELKAHPGRDFRRIPQTRLRARLGIEAYNVDAPWHDVTTTPRRVELPLKQHAGAPAVALVKVGDRVQRGDVVGEIPENALGARVHASIDGTVTQVGQAIVIEAS